MHLYRLPLPFRQVDDDVLDVGETTNEEGFFEEKGKSHFKLHVFQDHENQPGMAF